MSSVTLTAAMRANLLSLQGTATLLGQAQTRLASGNKVNTALDNPSSFFAAQGLNNRASDLSALLDGMGQGIQTLKSVDTAITSITALVKQAKATAQTALSDGSTVASGAIIMSGDFSAAIAANLTAAGGFTALATITLTSSGAGGANTTTAIAANDTLEGLAAEITALGGGGIFRATVVNGTVAGSVRLRIENIDGGVATNDTTIANTVGTAVSVLSSGGGVPGGATGYESKTGAANGALATATTAGHITSALNNTAGQTAYNDILAQIQSVIDDSGYQGTNLLQATGTTLSVKFSEKNAANKEDVASVNLYTNMTLANATWTDSASINASLATIDTALSQLRTQASTFGNALAVITSRQDFTTNLIGVLKDGATQLTIADKNEEGANLLALQTTQQLGIQALALASQANQSVLRLFA